MSNEVISVETLKKLIESNDQTIRVLDANIGASEKANYDKSHIKNAIFFDIMNSVTATKFLPKNVPDKDGFQSYLGSLGVSNEHHVVVYDRTQFGFFAAARAWWLLKYFGHQNVSVLNGGFNKWVAEEGEVTDEEPKFAAENFVASENKEILRDFDQVEKNLESKEAVMLDARPPDAFNGVDKSSPGPLVGHIKGAVSVPLGSLMDSNGLLKDQETLQQLLKQKAGEDKNHPVITYCMAGMTGCGIYLAASVAEYKNLALYLGSWTEFSQRASAQQVEPEQPQQ